MLFDLDPRLGVRDLDVQFRDLILQVGDERLFLRDLNGEQLLGGSELIERGGDSLLGLKRAGDVAAQARLEQRIGGLVGVGGRGGTRDSTIGGCACARAGRGRRAGVGGESAGSLKRKQSCDREGGGEDAPQARALRKPNSAVPVPRMRPAVMTAARTYCTAVAPTPGSTWT